MPAGELEEGAPVYVATGVLMACADNVVETEISDNGALVGNAGIDDPCGRVTHRLGRGTSRSVVTTAGEKPKVL